MGWTLIDSQVLSSSQASVTFSSIPQTYKTLKLVVSARGDNANVFTSVNLTFNGSSATAYSYRILQGSGSAASSAAASSQTSGYAANATGSTATTSTFASIEYTFPNYASSVNKPYSIDGVTENNGTTAYQDLDAGLWSNTSAITSLTLIATNNFVSGSTFTLYGLS